MAVIDQIASLLIAAEQASAEAAVTLDVFRPADIEAAEAALTDSDEGPAPRGRIVADGGRICWVTAKGYDATMSDLLAAATGIPARQLEEVYEVARTESSPFCETVVAAGLVSGDEVHETLRGQTADALRTLAAHDIDGANSVRVARIPRLAYDPVFTFNTLEVLEAVVARSDDLPSVAAMHERFAHVADRATAALLFLESDGPELAFVPIAGGSACGIALHEAMELALAGLDASQPGDAVLAEITPFPLVNNGESEWWLCEHVSPYLALYQVNGREEYMALLEALVAQHRAA